MNATELRDYILTQMSAEEALLKLLQPQVEHYNKIKVKTEQEEADQEDDQIIPLAIIAAAAADLEWAMAIERGREDEPLRGLAIGTEQYLSDLFNPKTKEDE